MRWIGRTTKSLIIIGLLITYSASIPVTPISAAAREYDFVWVAPDRVNDYPDYSYVLVGRNNDIGEDMYVCQAYIETVVDLGYHPGKLVLSNSRCYVSFGGSEWAFLPERYEVLLSHTRSYSWVDGPFSYIDLTTNSYNPYSTLYNRTTGAYRLYSCAVHLSGVQAGKLSFLSGAGICHIPYNGQELNYTSNYSVLIGTLPPERYEIFLAIIRR